MARIIPLIPAGSHYAGDDHYWAVMRDGRVERTSRALRQCEVGAVRGGQYLCSLSVTELPFEHGCAVCMRRGLGR